jgi:HK97 family phage major capsid protein
MKATSPNTHKKVNNHMSTQDTSRLNELQGALRSKMSENKAIADSFRVEDGVVVVSTAQKTAFDKNMADIREIKSLISGLEAMGEVESWGGAQARESVAQAAAAQAQSFSQVETRSIGEAFLASAEFKSLGNGRNGANMAAPFQYNGSIQVKDVYTTLPTGTMGNNANAVFGTVQRDPMIVPPKRTKRVRDLFPARSTTSTVIEYFRMTGFTNNAAAVAERVGNQFGIKPQSSMSFEGAQTSVKTLAHWEAAHRNVLADEPQLRSIIDNELMYGLRLQEDAQILLGDGTGENLLGVLKTPGIQTYNWSSGATDAQNNKKDSRADALRRAVTLSLLAYYEPSGIVIHPNDWEQIELTKDANGQYLVAASVALGGEPRVWRVPLVESVAMPEGTALVGSFGQGAQLYDREQANIRISEQHADFFIRNAIVILAEQRLALAVKRPESFVRVSFDSAPA